ncbi:MAG: ABC transporter permease [Clostridiales bacterium]|nr:ABC transporter permease [Eubacteriales bacterium]MDH7566208.1 ABC transporter permease [Clostridiales bacterium]
MKRFLLKRLLALIPVLLGVSVVTFALINLTPGDPAEIAIRASGVQPTSEAVEAMRQKLGLEGPVYRQYIRWLWKVIHLDLGQSFNSGLPVAQELLLRFPATLRLALCALAFTAVIALPLGIFAAIYPGSPIDHISRVCALLGSSMPGFWLGLLLIYALAVRLKLFPVVGMGGIKHLVLPAFTLGFGLAAPYIRLLKTSMLEVLQKDFINTARAKGLRERLVIARHALKNALLPAVTLLGMNFGGLLSGSFIVETIFSWPGIGKYAVDAIFLKDYTVIQGYVLLMAVIFVLVNLLVDLCYVFLDPRIRLS